MAKPNSLQKYQGTQAVNSPKTAKCSTPCCDKKDNDEALVKDAKATIAKVGADNSASKDCKERASNASAEITRFNSYREALPYARAANELNKLGDKKDSSDQQYKRKALCIKMLPADDAIKLNAELGLPQGTITDKMLRNDDTGFRAAVFKDEATGKLILVGRDTQPDSLVDWETNTRQGEGHSPPQYKAMGNITRELKKNNIDFDISGYSKGGGLAQEAGLINKNAKVFVFNSAGLHKNSLNGSGYKNFDKLAARTRSYSSEGEFLTFMNNTTDPQRQIANARFLRKELAHSGGKLNPLALKYRNPNMRKAYSEKGWFDPDPDPGFKALKKAYIGTIDDLIKKYVEKFDAGIPFQMFPPVRTNYHETVLNSGKWIPGLESDSPNLPRMAQHLMSRVLSPMETSVKNDRLSLDKLVRFCGR